MAERTSEFLNYAIEAGAKPDVIILGKSFTLTARFFSRDEDNPWKWMPFSPEQPVAYEYDSSTDESDWKRYLLTRKPSGQYECKIMPPSGENISRIYFVSADGNPPYKSVEVDVYPLDAYKNLKNVLQGLIHRQN